MASVWLINLCFLCCLSRVQLLRHPSPNLWSIFVHRRHEVCLCIAHIFCWIWLCIVVRIAEAFRMPCFCKGWLILYAVLVINVCCVLIDLRRCCVSCSFTLDVLGRRACRKSVFGEGEFTWMVQDVMYLLTGWIYLWVGYEKLFVVLAQWAIADPVHFLAPCSVVTCEIKLFRNYFSFRRHPTVIILFQRMETCLKLFRKLIATREYFPNMFIVAEIIFLK